MPTIAGLVAAGATITTPAPTDLLWCNQGTGSDRDKAITSTQVVTGGHATAVAAMATSSGALGTEFLAITGGGVSKKITGSDFVDDVVGVATVVTDLSSKHVVLHGASGVSRASTSAIVSTAIDASKITPNGPTWEVSTGVNVAWGSIVSAGWYAVRRTPCIGGAAGYYDFRMHAEFLGVASSSSKTDPLGLLLLESVLPTGWADEMHDSLGSGASALMASCVYRTNAASPTEVVAPARVAWVGTTTIGLVVTLPALADIMPLDNTAGAILDASFTLAPSDLLAGL